MATTPVAVRKATPPAPSGDTWRSLRTEMDRLFDRFSGVVGMPSLRRMFDTSPMPAMEAGFSLAMPAVEVTEDEKAYKVSAELPGLGAKDVEISISGDMLVIKGEKQHQSEKKDTNYHMTERSYGTFQRSFALPDRIDRDKITADLSKGVLTIALPKSAEGQKPAKKIEVKTAA